MSGLDLIQFIAWYATHSGSSLTTVRLVKFVYLADLYFAISHQGRTLTGYPWAFIYYGPYCSEVMGDIDSAVAAGMIRRESMEGKFGKDYQLFSCRGSKVEAIGDLLPIEVVSPLKKAIKKYGDDTQALLDHVYFETEPMEEVRKGDLLDFSKARAVIRTKIIPIPKPSKKQVESGKACIAGLVAKLKKSEERLREDAQISSQFEDDIFHDALKAMDGEDLETGLHGTARIE